MYVYDQVLHSTFVSKNYQVQFDMMDCEKYYPKGRFNNK